MEAETERLYLMRDQAPEDSLKYALHLKGDGEGNRDCLGSVCFEEICCSSFLDEVSRAQLVFFLEKSFRGHGYMLEALRWMLENGFSSLGLEEVVCRAKEEDKEVAAVLKKLGFAFDPKAVAWVLLESMYRQSLARERMRLKSYAGRYRIALRERDGSLAAEIEFPEIARGNYRIVRLYVAPLWEGRGLRGELLDAALWQIGQAGGNVSASDPFAKAWLLKQNIWWKEGNSIFPKDRNK